MQRIVQATVITSAGLWLAACTSSSHSSDARSGTTVAGRPSDTTVAVPPALSSQLATTCAATPGPVVTVAYTLDDFLAPACQLIRSNQRLRLTNNSKIAATATVGDGYMVTLKVGQSFTFPDEAGKFLRHGMNVVSVDPDAQAQVWLDAAPPSSGSVP